MKLDLPEFKPSERERQWVAGEIRTSQLIGALWAAAGPSRRRDPMFISLLVACGWTNVRADDSGWDSTRDWRNRQIAGYLGIDHSDEQQLVADLSKAFPRLRKAGALVASHTGITHYYKSLRADTLKFVERNANQVGKAFALAAAKTIRTDEKIRRIFDLLANLGPIQVRDRIVSPQNGLTPAIACLDPRRRVPIVNSKTRRLLQATGQKSDSAGALALSKLIGNPGIKHAFDLDVYAATRDFQRSQTPRSQSRKTGQLRDVGIKSEIASIGHIAANKVKITKQHNMLTNLLCEWLLWRHVIPKESRFDALIPDWKKGRHLLIEAKTAFSGPSGRAQIRQAIGQLFDYRHSFADKLPPGSIDLAVLLPAKPSDDVRSLLGSLKIEVLWFEGKTLKGTVQV